MIHALVAPDSIRVGEQLELNDEERHHLRVRRVVPGTLGRVLDGHGAVGMGTFVGVGNELHFHVDLMLMQPKPPETVIAVGGGDRDRFLWLAEKVAELGVTRLIPLATSETRAVESRVRDGVVAKARRRALEGCKQSGNAWTPIIDEVRPIDGLAEALPRVRWFLANAGGGSMPTISANSAIGWLIGPEAGFGISDLESLDNQLSPVPVALGQHIMRFETAAMAAAVVTEMARMELVRQRRG